MDPTCPGSGNTYFADCKGGHWMVNTIAVCVAQGAFTCGAQMCSPGEVCVTVGNMQLGCAADPCPKNTSDCECYHTVCPQDHPLCTGNEGSFIECM